MLSRSSLNCIWDTIGKIVYLGLSGDVWIVNDYIGSTMVSNFWMSVSKLGGLLIFNMLLFLFLEFLMILTSLREKSSGVPLK